MIQNSSFFGFSLHTLERRRVLVVAYYFVLLLLAIIGLYKVRFYEVVVVAQVSTIGGALGGIRTDGPVKPYRGTLEGDYSSGVLELNLNGRRPRRFLKPLDERERLERDHAHYIAFKILSTILGVFALLYWAGMGLIPSFLAERSITLLWSLFIVALSLPQSVILWTEPQPLPDGEIALVR